MELDNWKDQHVLKKTKINFLSITFFVFFLNGNEEFLVTFNLILKLFRLPQG